MKTNIARIASIAVLTITLLTLFTTAATMAAHASQKEQAALSIVPPQQDRPPVSPGPGCCVCPEGSSYSPEHKSCIKSVCVVRGMPDGDKGGGFFALHGTIFQNVACLPVPDLNLTAATGQPGWKVSGPGAGPIPVNVAVVTGWSPPIPSSSWISIDSRHGDTPGTAADYTYTFDFCLCAGYSEPQLIAKLLADNCITSIKLNQTTILPLNLGSAMPCPQGFTGTGYTYSTMAGFQAGTNTVTIVVHNNEYATGLDAILQITARNGQCPRRNGGPVLNNPPPDSR